MAKTVALWVVCLGLILAAIATPIIMAMSYDYRWKKACTEQGGMYFRPAESTSSRICIRGPVEIIPISVSPF